MRIENESLRGVIESEFAKKLLEAIEYIDILELKNCILESVKNGKLTVDLLDDSEKKS